MSEWCSAQPWMTFFILMSLFQSPLFVIRCCRRGDQ